MQSTQRHEVLFEQKECLWQKDVPVIIEETILVSDKETGKLYVRNTLRSMSEKIITAVMVSVACKDVWGNDLENNGTFQYLDLKVGYNSVFGQNEPIELKNSNTRAVSATIDKILFEDGSIVECSADGIRFPAPELLSEHLNSSDLASEYARETVSTAKYVPCEFEGFWRCACGAINNSQDEECVRCHSILSELKEKLNQSSLLEEFNKYKKEQAEKAERERIAEQQRIKDAELRAKQEQEALQRKIREAENEKRAKARAKKVKTAIIVTLILLILSGVAYFTYIGPEIVQPMISYNNACSLLANKQYTNAIKAFEEISYYKDSSDKILECKYGYIQAHKNNDDSTTFSYLKELKGMSYKDTSSIYSDLYDWHLTVVGWNSSESSTTGQSSISKYKPVYCHMSLSGGTPGAKTVISVRGTTPDGDYIDYTFDEAWEDGSSGWYGWSDGIYTHPQYGRTGTISVRFYDSDFNLIGQGSVNITN